MPTPQELRKIAEKASKEKSLQATDDYAKRTEEKVKQEAELLIVSQAKAKMAIAHAEANMTKVAEEGLSAALVYQAEGYEVVEQSLRSLGSGSKVDSPDRFFCSGAAKIVFDHFKDAGYNVVVVSHQGPRDSEGKPTQRYYIKVGW